MVSLPFIFPIGKETEHSVKLLYKCFCNNIFLGQWELAKACITRLHSEKRHLTTDIKSILIDIINYPFNRSVNQNDFGSSHHLSWLCLQEYKKLLTESQTEEKDYILLEKSCEFRLLLLEACGDVSDQVLKDLCQYQKSVTETFKDIDISSQPSSLSADLLKFLQDKLLQNPLLGHSLIISIYACPKHSQYKKNNENLQGLYVKAVTFLLDKISFGNVDKSDGQDENGKVGKVYQLLSLYNPEAEQYQNYLSIRELFAKIYELSVVDKPVIERNKVLSVLIGRDSNYLVEEFCKVEYDLEYKYLLSTSRGHQLEDLSEEQKFLLSLSHQKEKKHQMRLLFLICLKKEQHVLKVVIDTCIALIKMGHFDELQHLLEPAEFQPLKPLLLLHGWSYCHSCQTAKQLLDILWTEESLCSHPALQRECNKLAYQIDLIKWCIDKTKPLVSEVALTNQHQRAADMFTGLENHSVLYVLHHSTRISSLNQKEVLDLLQKSPVQSDKGFESRPKTKSVTFAETKVSETSSDDSPSQSTEINIERWKDISIFSGYCAIKNVMDAIYFCVDYSDSKLTSPIHRKDFRSQSLISSSSDSGQVQLKYEKEDKHAHFQEVYTANVTEKLNSALEYLSKLQPLTYRVEVLQDIFSLLFVNHECIQETAFYDDSDSGEDDLDSASIKNAKDETSGSNFLSEDGLTSPEATTPSPNEKSFDVGKGQNVGHEGLVTNGSYDEPFIEKDKKRERKSSKNDLEVTQRPRTKSESLLYSKILGKKSDIENLVSENGTGSTFSTDSSIGMISVGFLNNEYLVRDILDMLKAALLDLEGAIFQVRGSGPEKSSLTKKPLMKDKCCLINVTIEEPLTNIVQCNVTKETLSSKMGALRNHIHEANWKYQLVCHDKIPKKPGEVLLEPVKVSMGTFEEEICTDLMGPKEIKRKRTISNRFASRTLSPVTVLESESQGGDSGQDGKSGGRRRRSRSRGRLSKTKFPAGIISLMLSSPETLLTMCIQRCNYNQASQVIKLQKLGDKPEALEVTFAQHFTAAVRKLHSLNVGSHKNTVVPSKPGQLSMKALGSVAAAGVATVSVSSIADELLSQTKLPIIPHPKCQVVQSSKLDHCFKQENCPSMILFDLLCTGCRSWETCNTLLDEIKSRRLFNEKPDSKKVSKSQNHEVSNRLKDMWEILHQFEVLLNQGGNHDTSHKHFSIRNVLLTFYKHSIQALLQTATIPLSQANSELYAQLLTELKTSIDKVEHVFQIYGKLPMDESRIKTTKTSPYTSPSSKSPRASPSKMGDQSSDKPVIHNAMKSLIQVLKTYLPSGGLVNYFVRSSARENTANRDYLQNLYDHLKGLAIVVAESEATSKENLVLPKNYFKMLDEGPISTIGKLMFSKKIPPSKLERVAKKLSLNLNHIIVHSCCPKIPSKHLPALTSGFRLSGVSIQGSRLMMNQPSSNQTENLYTANPEVIAREIMTKLVFLMKDIAKQNNPKGLFEESSAKMMIKTSEFAEIILSTQRLKSADLDQLKTKEEKVSFFGNLQNLMFIHMCLMIMEEQTERKEEDVDLGVSPSEMIFTDMKPMDQLLYLNMCSYCVGQMGFISLFDLKYLINRNGLIPPTEWNGLLQNSVLELDPEDPWTQYIPPPDPRLLFISTNCSSVSPAVQVLDPELLKSQLQLAMRDYLDSSVTANVENKEVHVPQLLIWYKQDFSHQQLSEVSPEDEGFIHVIAAQMTGEKQTSLQELLQLDRVHSYSGENIDEFGRVELPFKLEVQSVKGEFLIAFDNSHLQQIETKPKSHKRNISLPKNIYISVSRSVTSSTSSFGRFAPKYSLTPSTLEYVKNECPLVATLVSLVCEDDLDEIDDTFTEDYFAKDESLRSRTPSEISVVDIKSYRYQRLTEDYPKLKRHLQNYIVPIAGSQDYRIVNSGDPVLKLITSAISNKLKACMLSLHSSQPFQEVIKSLFSALIEESKWVEVIKVLQSFPSNVLQTEPRYRALVELCLQFIIYQGVSQTTLLNSDVCDNIYTCLKSFSYKNKACHILLSIYRKLPLDILLDLFNSFINDDIEEALKVSIEGKLQEINLFSRITECAKTLQLKLSMSSNILHQENKGDYHSMLERFSDWRNVVSVIPPDEVLTVLLKAKDFNTAKKWCKLQKFSKEEHMTVAERQLLYLLNEKDIDTTKAFLLLEDLRIEDENMCFKICDNLVKSLDHHREILFIISYALKHLTLSEDITKDYNLIRLGSKALLCLPDSLHEEYKHLVKCPNLLLEQLLMNMKIDLAGKVYNSIFDDLEPGNTPVSLSKDTFKDLVTSYAKKALDFTVVLVPILEKDRSQSQMSSASSDKLDSQLEISVTPTKKSFTESTRGYRRSIDMSASPRASISGSSGKLLPGKRSKVTPQKFIMPPEPPPPEKWQPDNSTETCMVCKMERFSMFNRRHHCRRCGRVVCGTCSTKKSLVNKISVRTCDDCYQQIFGNRIQEVEEEMYSNKGDTPSDSSLTRTLTPGLVLPVTNEKLSMADAIHHTEMSWGLESEEEEANEFTREDFYFEQAPSTALCLSILGLHDDTMLSGQLMLEMCDDLSRHLKPIAPGVPNPEVDYSLLLSMMKTLLFHAKISFVNSKKGGDGISKCDLYQTRIDLLSTLVSANFTDLPSLLELTKPDVVMRLRDSLIRDERLSLAVDVSTKCGLDPTGVWVEWGMNCLQSGEFPAAREKFSRCLKPPIDRNLIQYQPSKVIADIIECLEAMPSTGQGEMQLLMSSSDSMKHLLSVSMNFTEQTATDSVPFQECLYYLKSYASYNIIIDFYRRNGYWMKAVQYILDHKCCSDVFVEALLIPSIKSGEWGKLVDQIVLIDPSLERWNIHLKATCKYLLKHKLHHILYEFQLIMKDFVRAAMTCITCFYQRGAESYLDLADRISHLYKANQHMQSFMDPSQWGSVSRPIPPSPLTGSWAKSGEVNTDSDVLIQSEEQVAKHLKMIAIQIEVTKFLHHCLKNSESDAASVATQCIAKARTSSQLPTMFGSNKTRTDLVSMILLSSNDVPPAFDLAFRIVKECKLGGQAIFTHAAREMAKHQRYDHIRQLLECVEKAGLGDDDMIDEIIGACILVVADNPNEAKEAENLIKLLRKDSNKINAFILCGKLRSAYLMAVKAERTEDVQRIAGAAQRMGQTAVKNICNKWLEQRRK